MRWWIGSNWWSKVNCYYVSSWKGSWVNWCSVWGGFYPFLSVRSSASQPLSLLRSLPALSSISRVLFPATSPPTTSSPLISVHPNRTSIMNSFLWCSIRLVCFLVPEWGLCFAGVFSSWYKVGSCCPCVRFVHVVPVWGQCMSSCCEVGSFHPICEVSACHPVFNVGAFCSVFIPVRGRFSSSPLRDRCRGAGARSWPFVPILGRIPSSNYEVGIISWCSSQYEVGALCPVLGWRHCPSDHPRIRLVPSSLVTLMYQAYCTRHLNPTLLTVSSSCFSAYLPVLASGGLSHHSVLSILNHNPRLGSICGEAAELEGREPIINTTPHLSWHSKRNVWDRLVLAWGA